MSVFKTYFYSFKRSLVSPDYYQDVLKAKFSFSLKFFVSSCFLLSLLLGMIYSLNARAGLRKFIQELENLPDYYPQDLILEIQNGELKTNQKEPYFIPLPELPGESGENIKTPIQNLLVIDTQGSVDNFEKYQSIALLTQDKLVVMTKEATQEIRVYPLKEVPDFTLNEAVVREIWQKISPYFQYIFPAVSVFIFLALLTSIPSSKFLHLLIFSLITLLAAKVIKTPLNYKKSLQLNLHAFILPTLVQEIFKAVGLTIPIPFFYSLVLLIFNLIILSSLKEKKVKLL